MLLRLNVTVYESYTIAFSPSDFNMTNNLLCLTRIFGEYTKKKNNQITSKQLIL